MHELSLCAAIAGIVTRRAGDRRVGAVHVRIGQLRQVVPETLEFCWTMVSQGTDLDGARLEVERVPVVLRCRACDAQRELGEDLAFVCTGCGGLDMEVCSGEEFEVTALDLEKV